jgi:N-acetylglutamate synthase
MSNTISIREFGIRDYDSAVALWTKVEGLEIAEGDDKESVGQFLKRNPHLSQAATDGSTIIGVVLCGHDGRRGHIYHLAVDPAYQRRGLGKRLLNECLEKLRNIGLQRAIIMVAADNPPGQSFWKRSGWEEISGAVAMGIDL